MSNTITTQFEDSTNSGIIKLYKNPFNNGAEYYARMKRLTVDSQALIARIQKRKAGTNEIILQQNVGFLKEEILEALRSGEAVNILDLGTLYIAPNAKYDGANLDPNGKQLFNVKFTASTLLQNAVSKLGVNEISYADTTPLISAVTDKFTENTDGILTAQKEVHLCGKRLKLANDEQNGVYLCPLDEKQNIVSDESLWLKSPKVTRNTQKYVDFYLPSEAQSGTQYRIAIRTSFLRGERTTKTIRLAVSPVVTVV